MIRTIMAACLALSFAAPRAIGEDLGRGINVNPWFTKPWIEGEWSRAETSAWSYGWPPFPSVDRKALAREIDRIADAGFDFLRVPINPGPFLPRRSSERRAAFADIRAALAPALDRDLSLVLELHAAEPGAGSYEAILADQDRTRAFIATVGDLVATFADVEKAYFETINEPTSNCDDRHWPKFQSDILAEIARHDTTANVILTGACYGTVEGLIRLNPSDYDFGNLNPHYTFHYYSPFAFTHQGNSWAGVSGLSLTRGLVWPARYGSADRAMKETVRQAPLGTPSLMLEEAKHAVRDYYGESPDANWIEADFERVRAWASDYRIPPERILLGEFGVLKQERKWSGADLDSAARWVAAVRRTAEEFGYPWTMWSYGEGMALTKANDTGEWYPELVDALRLPGGSQ